MNIRTLVRGIRPVLGGMILFAAGFNSVQAVQTDAIEHSGLPGFLGSELNNLSLTSEGIVQLAPSLKIKAELGENLVFRTVAHPEGGWTLSLGTRGRIVHVNEQGEMTELWVAGSLVRAMAYDQDGALWVGVSHAGRMFRLLPGQSPELVFQLEDPYVWDIQFDGDNQLWVATGDRGRLYRWNPETARFGDSPERVYEAPARQLTTLAFANNGDLYIGGAPEGMLLKRDVEGNVTALYKSDLQEVNQILPRSNGEVWFSAVGVPAPKGSSGSGGNAGSTPPPSSAQSSSNLGSIQTVTNPQRAARSLQGNGGNIQGVLYRLKTSGFVDELWKLPKVAILGLVADGDNAAWLGTNHEGRLYRVTETGEWSLVHELSGGKEISLLAANEGEQESRLTVISSNPGRILALQNTPAEKGVLISSVSDAGTLARWGGLRVISSSLEHPQGVHVFLRSGNTPEPDSTWSSWQDGTESNGIVRGDIGIARYMQYKIEFTNSESRNDLKQVVAYYQTPNEAPVVSLIRILGPGLGMEQMPTPPRNMPSMPLEALLDGKSPYDQPPAQRTTLRFYEAPGVLSIVWKAEDANKDPMEYSLYLKGDQEQQWFPLVEGLDTPAYTLETLGLNEGLYQVKVVASDLPGNPSGDDLKGSRISQLFMVDNTAPDVKRIDSDNDKKQIRLQVTDALSRIVFASYSWNGEVPKALLPEDGIFDSRTKEFAIAIPQQAKSGGEHLLFRVWDESGNVALFRWVLSKDKDKEVKGCCDENCADQCNCNPCQGTGSESVKTNSENNASTLTSDESQPSTESEQSKESELPENSAVVSAAAGCCAH